MAYNVFSGTLNPAQSQSRCRQVKRTFTVLFVRQCIASVTLSGVTLPHSGRVTLVAVRVTSCTPHSNNCLNPERISLISIDRFGSTAPSKFKLGIN